MLFPFPGMNPYLEHPEIWSGVHHWLIVELARFISPLLRPKYRVAVEVRIYETIGEQSLLVPIPEIVKQGYLEVREVATSEVITAIEILSPINKRSIAARKQYESKRNKVLGSSTHLVEIDLLRQGQPMPVYHSNIQTHYRILVSQKNRRPQADLYTFNLPDPIPLFPLTLKSGDQEPLIDLQLLLNNVYDQASYDLAIDYTQEPVPPLSEADRIWMNKLLIEQQLRSPS